MATEQEIQNAVNRFDGKRMMAPLYPNRPEDDTMIRGVVERGSIHEGEDGKLYCTFVGDDGIEYAHAISALQ